MRTDPLRVTVLLGGRRTDVAVPAGLPVAELLPLLVGTGGRGRDSALGDPYASRHLVLPGGPPLDPEAPLEDQDVRPGAVLAVTCAPARSPVPDDPAEALGAEVGRTAAWTNRHRDAVRPPVVTVLGLLAAAAVVLHPDPVAGGSVGALGALALLVLAAWSSRSGRDGSGLVAVLAAVLGCALAAAAAAAVVGGATADRTWLASAGPSVGAAVVVTALAGAGVVVRRRGLLVAAVLPGATLTVLGLAARGPAEPVALLAGAVTVLVLLGGVVPAVALALVGRGGEPLVDPYAAPRDPEAPARGGAGRGSHGDAHALRRDAVRAADLLAGFAGGAGVLLVGAAPLLALAGRPPAALGVVLALHLLLRARRSHGVLLVAADLGCGALALVGVVGVLVVTDPTAREVLAPVLALVAPLLLLGPLTSVGARRLGDLAETGTAVALLPLLVVASGLLDAVGG